MDYNHNKKNIAPYFAKKTAVVLCALISVILMHGFLASALFAYTGNKVIDTANYLSSKDPDKEPISPSNVFRKLIKKLVGEKAVLPRLLIKMNPEKAAFLREASSPDDLKRKFFSITGESLKGMSLSPVFLMPRNATKNLSDIHRWFKLELTGVEKDASLSDEQKAIINDIAGSLSRNPYIEAVEFDSTAEALDDPLFYSQWALHNTGGDFLETNTTTISGTNDCDLDGPEAWLTESPTDVRVVVAVVDTGVDFRHPDLSSGKTIYINLGECPTGTDSNNDGVITVEEALNQLGNVDVNSDGFVNLYDIVASGQGSFRDGIDNDGNGYPDDIIGFDFSGSVDANQDGDFLDSQDIIGTTIDMYGHGTHCAGIISAIKGNNIGIQGTWSDMKVTILPVQILNDTQGSGLISDVALGIVYAADQGARVISCSFGAYNVSTTLMADAITYANAHNALVVAAAGNDGINASYMAPANIPNAITVSATDANDARASFSNYGSLVDVSAPGVLILSLEAKNSVIGNNYPSLVVADPLWSGSEDAQYLILSGTSMACPYVAGVAAAILSRYPSLSIQDVEQRLKGTTDPIDALNSGNAQLLGTGRVNLFKALTAPEGYHCVPINIQVQEITGNNNGTPDPGETVSVKVTLKNYWEDAINLTAALTVNGQGATVTSGNATFGNILSGQVVAQSTLEQFIVVINANAPAVTSIPLSLTLTDSSGKVEESQILLKIGSLFVFKFANIASVLFDCWEPLAGHIGGNNPNIPEFVTRKAIISGGSNSSHIAYENYVPLWSNTTPLTGMLPNVMKGDFTPNPGIETVFAELISNENVPPRILVYSANGNLLNSTAYSGSLVEEHAAALDCDNDSYLDLVTISGYSVKVYSLALGLQLLWQYTLSNSTTNNLFRLAPSIADLDGDGTQEIIVPTYNAVYVLDTTGALWDPDNDGVSNWPWVVPSGEKYPTILIGDMDYNGTNEIIVITTNLASGNQHSIIHCLTANAEELSGNWPVHLIPQGSYQMSWQGEINPILVDVDHDYKPEIIMPIHYKPSGQPTVVSGIRIVRSNGTVYENMDMDVSGVGFFGISPAVADINGDNIMEVLATDMIEGRTYLWSLKDDNGDGHADFLGKLPYPTSYSGDFPILDDMDPNGKLEFIRTGASQQYSIEFPYSNTDAKNRQWPQGRHDALRSNCWQQYSTEITQNIPLGVGWQTISFNVTPLDTSPAAIFSSVASNMEMVKDGDGNVYWPAYGVDQINNISTLRGYQIKMGAQCTLSVTGIPVGYPVSVPLVSGWQIIGYPAADGDIRNVADVFANIPGVIIVKNGAGQVYWPQFGVNTIGNMIPGQGYQVKMSQAGVLTLDAPSD